MPRTHLLTILTATPFTSLLDHGPALASMLQPCPSGLSSSLEPSDLPRTQIWTRLPLLKTLRCLPVALGIKPRPRLAPPAWACAAGPADLHITLFQPRQPSFSSLNMSGPRYIQALHRLFLLSRTFSPVPSPPTSFGSYFPSDHRLNFHFLPFTPYFLLCLYRSLTSPSGSLRITL